jgi:hypothetical protein
MTCVFLSGEPFKTAWAEAHPTFFIKKSAFVCVICG